MNEHSALPDANDMKSARTTRRVRGVLGQAEGEDFAASAASYFARGGKVAKAPPGFERDVTWRKRLRHIHSAPRTPKRTARLHKTCLVSGAPVTGRTLLRLGCRPAQSNQSILLSKKAPAAQELLFPLSNRVAR